MVMPLGSAKGSQRAGQSSEALVERPVGDPDLVAVDDLLVRGGDQRGIEQMPDRQREIMGFRGPFNEPQRHLLSPAALSNPKRTLPAHSPMVAISLLYRCRPGYNLE